MSSHFKMSCTIIKLNYIYVYLQPNDKFTFAAVCYPTSNERSVYEFSIHWIANEMFTGHICETFVARLPNDIYEFLCQKQGCAKQGCHTVVTNLGKIIKEFNSQIITLT